MTSFTRTELEYLRTQRLGRLATIDPSGTPQNNPVGFSVADDGAVVIGGRNLGQSRKFKNLATHDRVSLVVDDLASTDPWVVRGVEIRGSAAAVTDVEPAASYLSREQIVIRPDRIRSWGLDPEAG
jgi:pyridoxamine 5'-phosphate oxidase family protein